MPGPEWSDHEVRVTVADYVGMLRKEHSGIPYNKAAHNRTLRDQLHSRTKAAVELKHQNISAVLQKHGYSFIPGYKPRGNFQNELETEVSASLQSIPICFQSRRVSSTAESFSRESVG